jgi:hypothetical protein
VFAGPESFRRRLHRVGSDRVSSPRFLCVSDQYLKEGDSTLSVAFRRAVLYHLPVLRKKGTRIFFERVLDMPVSFDMDWGLQKGKHYDWSSSDVPELSFFKYCCVKDAQKNGKAGKVARTFGLTLDQLMAVN